MKQYILKAFWVPVLLLLFSCNTDKTEPINFGEDQCSHCRMTIEDPKYGTELITKKGRVYKFDDLSCMESYVKENAEPTKDAKLYVPDFKTTELFPLEQATKITGGEVQSPMDGNIATFKNKEEAVEESKKLDATIVD